MNIKQLMVTFFIALLAGGEIGARVLTVNSFIHKGRRLCLLLMGSQKVKRLY